MWDKGTHQRESSTRREPAFSSCCQDLRLAGSADPDGRSAADQGQDEQISEQIRVSRSGRSEADQDTHNPLVRSANLTQG
jgi:hypothetical protein